MKGTFLAPTSSTTPSDKLLKVLKDLHGKLMDIINNSHKRLVSTVENELQKAQDHIERPWKQQVGEADNDGDDVDNNGQDADGDDEGQQGDGDGHDNGETGYEDDAAVGTAINIVEYHGENPTREGGTNEGEKSIVPYPVQQQDAPRRSQRPKKPKNMSPWTLTKPLKRPRKAKEKKAIFFDLISGSCTKEESEQILIEIDDEDITREQLQTLGCRNKLSNRTLLAGKPSSWKVSEWKQQLLLEHTGYNIGDCDLIIGPMLVEEHWFCMVLDPSMMNFYVLNSMRTKIYMSKNESSKKKKTAFVNPQATTITKIVSYMHSSFSYD
ncbi:hypothetical protein K1719_030670 [Acacia pycnantha]|nr:hypothetical protein K1719_030670 [Acacia pycnantha]